MIVFQIELHLFLISSESSSSRGIGLIRMFKEILHSSSTCSLDLDSSLRASIAGAEDSPPFSFWAAIISCLFSLSSLFLRLFLPDLFLLFSLFHCQGLFLFCPDFLPLGLFFLEPLQLCLLLGPFIPPLVDIFFQLFIEFIL